MSDRVASLWVYLSASPLLHLTLTVCLFVLARFLYRQTGRRSWMNPVLSTVLALVAILIITDTPYDTYFEGAQFVHFMLGPATVALAIPLYRQWSNLKRHPLALAVSLLSGSLTAVVSAILIAKLGGVSEQALVSIAPKSVTTPVAMGITEGLGGLPSLTAVVVILTGILGASLGPWLLDKLRVTNPMAKGLAMGTASHGIGTGRAIFMGDVAAAFAGLAIGLNGLATAILLPVIWSWLAG